MKYTIFFAIILLFNLAYADKKSEKLQLLSVQSDDFVIGDIKAPITMIEYSSLACPHCAKFHASVFPQIKSEYIDKGVVKYIFRDFPTTKSALSGCMLIKCSKNKLAYITTLFENQASWAFDAHYKEKLENIAKLGGMSSEEFSSCMQNQMMQEDILFNSYRAVKVFEIDSTPIFFINGTKLEGETPFKMIQKTISQELTNLKLSK